MNEIQRWSVDEPSPKNRRQRIYIELHKILFNLSPNRREEVMSQIRKWADPAGAQPTAHRIMTADELVALSSDDIVEIGAHTNSHPALSRMTRSIQEEEIVQGRARLEEWVSRPVRNFAYPYGSLTSFNSTTIEIIRANKFDTACTTFSDAVRPGCDPYQLPRLLIRNWSGDDFEDYLHSRIGH
jgi:peptidoglycan/xylan/chitin deacetylase (PgdA/CDA1 family)